MFGLSSPEAPIHDVAAAPLFLEPERRSATFLRTDVAELAFGIAWRAVDGKLLRLVGGAS